MPSEKLLAAYRLKEFVNDFAYGPIRYGGKSEMDS
ncbi:hypothetical protein COMA2_220029 [Candidatus Nitrospira nitrificans]|uniref:Uncharacterized protein n=1 Tax=Candidatus Nitrospira nitrificans TaxID=1742973 RepID=A0A0S4LFF6_9BACT|nr:hypothetical protein COMA2_220029 [Candidatus Nitrospira nitrificans]